MRAVFSSRLNNIFYENLFVYRGKPKPVLLNPIYITCNTALEMSMPLNLRDYTQGNFYFNGLPNFFLDLVSFASEKTAFFDLGANIGIISVAMSKFIPHGQIVAVEAIPETYGKLVEVFESNCPSANAYNLALSSSPGFLKFNRPSTDSGSSSASISPEELIKSRKPNVQIINTEIYSERFDTFYEKLDSSKDFSKFEKHVFKIDVEGHEVELLTGMSGYLAKYKGEIMIVVEVRPNTWPKVSNILDELGFIPSFIFNENDLNIPLRDCIFRRPAK